MKEVKLIIEIDKRGKIVVTSKGTVGKECLELMAFLDKIEGLDVIQTVSNEDMNKKDQIVLKNRILEQE